MFVLGKAILPAATAELHHNGDTPFLGDKVAGIDRSSSKTESGLRVAHTLITNGKGTIMNPIVIQNFESTFSYVSAQTLTQISVYLPRIVIALLILIIGSAIARALKKVVVAVLDKLMLARVVKNTPVDLFLKNAEFGQRFEVVIGSVLYWLIMLVVLHLSVSVLGLEPVSALLERVLSYIPRIISAVLVLFFGVLMAGVVESLVKGAIKSIDGQSSRLLGKVASYLIVSISVLAAVSELGIATQFILILFIGLVAMLALGFGLAIGLGAKDVVNQALTAWYNRTMKEVTQD